MNRRRDRGRRLDRRLRVRDSDLERAEPRVWPQLPPPQVRRREPPRSRPPTKLTGEALPAREGGGNALPRKRLSDLWAHGCHARVAALVEGGVRGERCDGWQMAPHCVVDRESALGATNGDVHLEARDELATSNRAVLLQHGSVALGSRDLALRRGEWMHAGDAQAHQ